MIDPFDLGTALHAGIALRHEKAQALLEKAKATSSTGRPAPYPGADFDLAFAHILLGRALRLGGQAALALDLHIESQRLFELLGERGARMAFVALGEQADCLTALGRLDEATEKYAEHIKRGEKLKDFRGVAVGKNQLADVLRRQGKYAEALAAYAEARTHFEQQNEPKTVATVWHQIGMVHQDAGNYAEAETAYRRSLEIETQTNNRVGQASSLTMLGLLYTNMGRLEEAVTFYRQAADIFVETGDLRSEGVARNNIASTLRNLKRYDEARTEIMRAIECKQNLGHAGTVWNAFDILHDIETAV
ncbi:MAG: tetratricopeptide repeat protein, partial [Gammaproteobacteria bacterium]|nr:tetratricopeptide repeat protein [Gammaproteobacteria bacterium]